MPHYYTPSGRTTSGKAVIAYISALVMAYCFAVAYTLIVEIIPLIYIKFLITALMAAGLGFAVRSIGKICKMRHKKEFLNLTYFGAFFLLYFSWIIFAAMVEEGSYSGALNTGLHFDIIFSPLLFFSWMAKLSGIGIRGFGSVPVNGMPLIITWIIEALILVIIPIGINYKKQLPPFSVKLDKWYPKYNLKQFFEFIVTSHKFREELEGNALTAIENLGKGLANRYGMVSVYYLKNDVDAYLSFTNIFIEKQGTGNKKETEIIHGLHISAKDAEYLIEKYKADKQFFLDH